jgi:hypothetical protein
VLSARGNGILENDDAGTGQGDETNAIFSDNKVKFGSWK